MIEIKDIKVYNLAEAIVKSGFPMDTGDLIENFDYHVKCVKHYINTEFTSGLTSYDYINDEWFDIGKKHFQRAKKLANTPSGSGHDCWTKSVRVSFNLKYSEYISPQLQRYNWFDIESSNSKMHRITKMDIKSNCNKYVDKIVIDNLQKWIDIFNDMNNGFKFYDDYLVEYGKNIEELRQKGLEIGCEDKLEIYSKYGIFMKIISNCPLGFEKWMGISTNYMQLKTILNQRKHHKLKEDYSVLCNDFILGLPLWKEIYSVECDK